MAKMPNEQKYKHSNKRGRAKGKRAGQATEAAPAPVLFETFESRVLLDAALPISPIVTSAVPNGTVLASDTQPGTVQDADGTAANVTISGNGHWQITQQDLAPAVLISGTDGASVVSITTGGGDGRFLFSGIDVEGGAASLTGTGVNLNGGLTLNGTVKSLFLGDLTVDASSSLSVGAKASDSVGALTVGKTTISTFTLNGGATLSSGASVLGDQAGSGGSTVTVSGLGSQWQVNGGLTIGAADSGSQLTVNAKGVVVLDALNVGAGALGGGTVAVSGVDSKVSVTGTAVFGDQGNGILSLQSGAVVTLGNATFGNTANALGQVTLTGPGTT